jgi:DNA-binding FadR family transcriptional regulator
VTGFGELEAFVPAGAVEHTFQQVSEAILNGGFQDGERLTEAQLVDAFQVSRPTVREALRMLGQAGMLERRRGRYGGWFVARRQTGQIAEAVAALVLLERITFNEIFEARVMLEATAASHAAHRTPRSDLELMRQAIRQSQAMPDDAEVFTRCNTQFHLTLVRASGNGILTIMLQSLRPLMDETLRQIALDAPYIEQANLMHHHILEAIEAGDPDAARAAVEAHLGQFRGAVEQTRGDLREIRITAREALLGSVQAAYAAES